MLGRLVEEVLLRAKRHLERHHQLLAQRVYGGVRDLREVLLEVREQELGPLGEDGQRGVGPHRSVGSLPSLAIGERSILRSSSVYPNASWRSKELEGSGRPSGVASGSWLVDLTRLQPPR